MRDERESEPDASLGRKQNRRRSPRARNKEAARCIEKGRALRESKRLAEALVQFEHALRLAPDLARAHAGHGYTLVLLGRLEEGIASYRKALRLEPDYWRAWNNLGGAYLLTADVNRAVACYRRGAVTPDLDSHLFALNYHSGRTPGQVFAAHVEWGRPYRNKIRPVRHRNQLSLGRKLRIGYVSGDFRNHAVIVSIEGVLAAHDRDAFEILCYDNSERNDRTTRRLRRLASRWRRITDLSDSQADALIRKDRIDILVDLSGHSSDNRMPLFARKPAPVQATYQGYPNTTGLDAIDYRITDAVADPPGLTDALHTEELVRLPRCFLCYRPPAEVQPVSPLPARSKSGFTFASFSNPAKWNDTVLDTWAAILRRVPASHLLLHHTEAGNEQGIVYDALSARIHGVFLSRGIAPERVHLVGHLPAAEHWRLYSEIDLALDPFPYNGTTATLEALWMGVPVVALEGAAHVSRVGKTLLAAAGLERFVAESIPEYERIAVRAASDPAVLAQIRSGMRARITQSPLLDAAGLARALEDAYRWMWQRFLEFAPA